MGIIHQIEISATQMNKKGQFLKVTDDNAPQEVTVVIPVVVPRIQMRNSGLTWDKVRRHGVTFYGCKTRQYDTHCFGIRFYFKIIK